MNRIPQAACGLLALAATAGAQSFSYPDFSSTAGLNLLGDAAQTGNTLQITDLATNETGWFWRTTAVPVVNGFDTTFAFRVTPGAGLAEGFALVIQDDPAGANAMGGQIWGMGYGRGSNNSPGLRNSIAIELDTFQDNFLNDTSNNEITVHTRGAAGNDENENFSIGRTTPAQSFSNAQIHTLQVVYVPGLLEVFYDGGATPVLSLNYDFLTGGTYANGQAAPDANLQTGAAFIGFCGTTGANNFLTERVEITSWDWTSTPLTDPCYAGTLGADTLSLNGSSGGFTRSLEIATFQPFDIELQNPPAFGANAPYVLFASFLPQPGAPGTSLGFGSTCFPVLPAGPTELVLADTFGIFPALLPAGPTPHTISIPAGVVTTPLDLTLQAVTFEASQPLTLGITNAVDVSFVTSDAPMITTVRPLSAAPGAQITITGSNFVPGFALAVNGAAVAPIQATSTEIIFPYPANVGCDSQLSVTLPDGQVVTSDLNPTPTVTSTQLSSGSTAGNAVFLVQGSGFATGTTVTIGGAPATILNASPGIVSMRTPPGTAGTAAVVLTTPGGCTATTTYTYL
ncbi:MAG: IPT/TIG domain-containing protein [Planctomycetota bacterium]